MAKRQIIVGDPDGFEEVDRGEVVEKFIEIEATGHNFGGKVSAAPVQRQIENGTFVTVAWVFIWDSYVPAVGEKEGDNGSSSDPR